MNSEYTHLYLQKIMLRRIIRNEAWIQGIWISFLLDFRNVKATFDR